jgi:ADP-ribose pyrophosphatase
MQVQVQSHQRVYNGHFSLERATLRYETYGGRMSQEVERLVFERGDSVAVLLYDAARDVVTLVEQFRYPVYLRELEGGRLLEIVAGILDGGRTPEEVARAEVSEETGYALERLEYISTFYLSPGACTERVHLYVGYVARTDRLGEGGGLHDEGEHIRVVELPLPEALRRVRTGAIRDAKTIIALQFLAADPVARGRVTG